MGIPPDGDKLTRLIALYDQFHLAINHLDDPVAKRLVESWTAIRGQYVTPTGAPRSAFATGMEQGLRETPLILQSMPTQVRKRAAEALAKATAAHYPQFVVKESARIDNIKARGFIRGEGEYHLVRNQVDVLEGDPRRIDELPRLYELLEKFEARGR
jgi:hypothetical protein